MVSFPNCKINLGLNIIGKRSDGYHDLETVFYPLQLKDAFEVIEQPENFQRSTNNADSYRDQCSVSGLQIDGSIEDNLCVKAYQLLKKDFPGLPPVQMHLHKTIPTGAGLGGGSADGAFTLALLSKKFHLHLSENQLIDYSLQLGSDCPFFVLNKPCFAKGRGEKLEEVLVDLSGYKIVLIHPGIHISTAKAFANIKTCLPEKSVKEIVQQQIKTWKTELKNDFEEYAFSRHSQIKKIKDELYTAGSIYASMTGSGSAVYGIFEKDKSLGFSFPEKFFTKVLVS